MPFCCLVYTGILHASRRRKQHIEHERTHFFMYTEHERKALHARTHHAQRLVKRGQYRWQATSVENEMVCIAC